VTKKDEMQRLINRWDQGERAEAAALLASYGSADIVLFCRLMLDNYDHQTACAELLRLTALLRTFNDVERRLGTGPAKGERGGRCNREACRTGQPATCRHRQTGRYYCPPCARQINEHNPPSGGAKPLVEIPPRAGRAG
jgi:hypothetical protein